MKLLRTLLALAVLPLAASAQDDGGRILTAGDALTQEMCERMRDDVIPRIEAFTRMKFRRPIPVRLEPKAVWERKVNAGGFAGMAGRHALAFYTPSQNVITVVPWVIGGYLPGPPRKKSLEGWVADLEPTMIHELTHGIHHQNFYTEGRFYGASLKPGGLTEEELDRSTVDFLLGEGVPELVALRTTRFPHAMHRHPRMLDGIVHYMQSYRPSGQEPYRMILMKRGYVDGLNLAHRVALLEGTRGIRAMLYRPPRRELLFQPQILQKVDLDDPPDPDSIFGFLAPEVLQGTEVRLAVNPGHGRYFEGAYRTHTRVPGCLLGYVAEVGETDGPHGKSRYAFFVADPDEPGSWSEAQATSLKELNPQSVKEKTASVPLADGVKADVLTVDLDDKSRYMRAETGGLVVLAHETKPTKTLEDRMLLALRALWIRRPTPDLYDEALKEALRNVPPR